MTATARKTIPLILAASAALAGLGAVSQGGAHEAGAGAAEAGFSCAIVTRDLGGTVEISGKVSARQAAYGEYALTIRQRSAAGQALIDQSGEFSVGEGRTVTLGQTSLGGTPGAYHADLTVTVGGRTYRCTDLQNPNEI
ncbi:MAG: curli-like amyloid fiber formation chaperone CsgH [Roseovarius sp.]